MLSFKENRAIYNAYKQSLKASQPTIECPYCHSTNTKKITNISKAIDIAVVGTPAIGRVSKQWHCNNCKSDF